MTKGTISFEGLVTVKFLVDPSAQGSYNIVLHQRPLQPC